MQPTLRTFNGNIPIARRELIDELLTKESVPQIKNILNTKTLSDFQSIGAAYAYLSNQAIIGDDPGLGKTVQTSAYLKLHKVNKTLKKILVVTESSAVYQVLSEIYTETGLLLLPVYGDAVKINRILKAHDYREYDGIITTHSALGVGNQFLRMFLPVKEEFNTIVYDESAALANNTSIRYLVAQGFFKYFDNKLMLNGTAITTKLDQLYNQINILNPTLLPSMDSINQEYGVYAKKNYYMKGLQLVDYKNAGEFTRRLKYNYLGRSRKDVGIEVDHTYNIHLVEQTAKQRTKATPSNYEEVLFNCKLKPQSALKEIPAIEKTIELTRERLKDGNVVIYAEYISIKPILKYLLESKIPNCRVGIIDGHTTATEGLNREEERLKFENGEYNVLIINIPKALNLGSANSMIFYTIPSEIYQAMLRIDRGLKGGSKTYDIIIYDDSRQIDDVTMRFLKQENLMNEALQKDFKTFRTICEKLQVIQQMKDILD